MCHFYADSILALLIEKDRCSQIFLIHFIHVKDFWEFLTRNMIDPTTVSQKGKNYMYYFFES